ncbi:unnamed protein product, partial [Urochloa humidicola]
MAEGLTSAARGERQRGGGLPGGLGGHSSAGVGRAMRGVSRSREPRNPDEQRRA